MAHSVGGLHSSDSSSLFSPPFLLSTFTFKSPLSRFMMEDHLILNKFKPDVSTSTLILTCVLLSLTGLFLNWYRERRRLFLMMSKIPGPPEHVIPLLGHSKIVLDLDRCNCQYGTYALVYQMLSAVRAMFPREKILRMWLGLRPFVLLVHPDSVETILSSSTLTQKSVEYDWLKPWLGEGLVTSNRTKWKARRKILTPAFHFKILKDFLPIMNEQAEVLVKKLRRFNKEGNSHDLSALPLMTMCTLDTICETAMGISINAQENESEYIKALHQVSATVISRLTRPWLWPDIIFNQTKKGKNFYRCLKIMHNFTDKVVQERRDDWIKHKESEDFDPNKEEDFRLGDKKRLAFLDLLLHQHFQDPDNFTLQDIREETDTFMFAGHDTTAMALSWAIYLLGLYPDIQDKLRAEIDDIFEEEGNNNIDDDDEQVSEEMMKKMKYMDCVLKEVQRLYPTAPFIARMLTEDTMIAGYMVPKGTTCGILTFILHRDSEIFSNPERFDPDRFLPENSKGRHPYAFVPFSAGPRNCIGQKFAMMEQKIVLTKLVRNFTLRSLEERDKLVVVGEMVLRPVNPLRVSIMERTFTSRQPLDASSSSPSSSLTSKVVPLTVTEQSVTLHSDLHEGRSC